jgi:hypothetical protein
MKKLSLIIFLLFNMNGFSQGISCDELLNFVKTKGSYVGAVNGISLDSSWLKDVTAYGYDGDYYVVAKIKKDKYSYSTSTYVFCGIPQTNWFRFRNGSYGDSSSYGERFHKYIIDYKCNCY